VDGNCHFVRAVVMAMMLKDGEVLTKIADRVPSPWPSLSRKIILIVLILR